MKRIHLLPALLFMALLVTGCRRPPVQLDGGLLVPCNKVWAHQVDDTLTAQAKEKLFDGMELNIVYSASQHQLFVGHNVMDTIKGLTLQQYLASLKRPQELCLWLDLKNITYNTADSISELIKELLTPYGLLDRAFVESTDPWSLEIVKYHGLHTSLWVESFYYQGIDTASWVEKVNERIQRAHPDAISCEYKMFGALTEFFPDHNIFLWHTPADMTPENVELTKTFCQHPSVKIVLVDYDQPIKY